MSKSRNDKGDLNIINFFLPLHFILHLPWLETTSVILSEIGFFSMGIRKTVERNESSMSTVYVP